MPDTVPNSGPARRVRRPRVPTDKISIRYYLRDEAPDQDGYVRVRGIARFHGQRFSFAPGVRVLPHRPGKPQEAWWEPTTGRVIGKHPKATELNGQLQAWEKKVKDAFSELAGPGGHAKVTLEALEDLLFPPLEGEAAPAADPATLSFAEHYEAWKQENTGVLSRHSLRKFQQTVDHLQLFNPALVAGDLSEKMALAYRKYLLSVPHKDGGAGLSDVTISKHYQFLRLVQQRLGRPEVAWLKYKGESGTQLGLEAEELIALLRVELTEPHLLEERARWVLQVFAGRRYEDMAKLSPAQLTRIKVKEQTIPALLHTQNKTTGEALAPLPPVAVRIGERYGWQFPAVANSDRNLYIKEVARRAGLTRLFNDVHVSGGRATDNYRPVHELISTHTARHTCAELVSEGGDDNQALAKFVLGHSEENVTEVYAKAKARRLGPKILEAWQQVLGEWYDWEPDW